MKAGIRDWGLGISSVTSITHVCPKCGCDDESMIETVKAGSYFCNTCSHDWSTYPATHDPTAADRGAARGSSRSTISSTRTGIRREELQTLADIGAFASFGYERREALWQVEKAVRPAGELFRDVTAGHAGQNQSLIPNPESLRSSALCRQ